MAGAADASHSVGEARLELVAVVGVRPRAALRSLIGRSVTDRLVNRAACPVAVARPRDRAS